MKLSTYILLTFAISLTLEQMTLCQVNHRPVLNFRKPSTGSIVNPAASAQFLVSVSDPDGDTLTYTWRVNSTVKKVGPDSVWTYLPSDWQHPMTFVICIFADPGGLRDSTYWHVGPDLYVEPNRNGLDFRLLQNYPNPFNPSTTIAYHISKATHVTLRIFNTLGQQVALLVNRQEIPGEYEVVWTTDLSTGIYLCRLETGRFAETRKLVLIK